jgi:hypothetical protein
VLLTGGVVTRSNSALARRASASGERSWPLRLLLGLLFLAGFLLLLTAVSGRAHAAQETVGDAQTHQGGLTLPLLPSALQAPDTTGTPDQPAEIPPPDVVTSPLDPPSAPAPTPVSPEPTPPGLPTGTDDPEDPADIPGPLPDLLEDSDTEAVPAVVVADPAVGEILTTVEPAPPATSVLPSSGLLPAPTQPVVQPGPPAAGAVQPACAPVARPACSALQQSGSSWAAPDHGVEPVASPAPAPPVPVEPARPLAPPPPPLPTTPAPAPAPAAPSGPGAGAAAGGPSFGAGQDDGPDSELAALSDALTASLARAAAGSTSGLGGHVAGGVGEPGAVPD